MNEHPDIADLSAEILGDSVKAHLLDCGICAQIRSDIGQLNIELGELGEKAEIPKSFDKKVYKDISQRSKEIRKLLFYKNLITSLGAIAAVVVLSFIIFSNIKTDKPSLADINGDGEINVLDSLFLAQKIDSKTFDGTSDLNDDGKLDVEDLQIVRHSVVSLGEELP